VTWEWFTDPGYWASRLVFQRLLASLYLVAFLGAALQFRALIGAHGLTPVPRFVRRVPFRRAPSLFHWHYSDRLFAGVAWTGVVVSATLVLGLFDHAPVWAATLAWLVPWLLYQSIVNVGQVWYAFGWESLMLEVGFLAIFLGPADTVPPVLVLWLLRWVLFRLEFGAGMIKMRGDPCWRDLTCLYHHHETQPMPGPLSWYFHHLPRPLHRIEAAASHVTQLVVPFALFAPQPVASAAAALMIATQLWLLASGNFAWLNVLTIAIAVSVVDGELVSTATPPPAEPPGWHRFLVLAVTILVVALSYRPMRNLVSREQLMNTSFDRLHLVNTYGAFDSVTKVRHEIVIEGSDGTVWHEYEFKGKPGDPRRRPRQFAPYHLRLDWLMWFAALSTRYARSWLPELAEKLLVADPATLRLLRHDPFDGRRPVRLRARLYRYRFTTPRERRETGAWWLREPRGVVLPESALGKNGGVVPVD